MRRKEERSEDIQRAQAYVEQGLLSGCSPYLAEAVRILLGLAYEDPYEYTDPGAEWHAGRPDQARDDLTDGKVTTDGWLQSRKQKIAEIGNPAQLFLRRAGPDGAEYNCDSPEECHIGANIGHIAWQGYNPDTQWDERCAQIYARYAGKGKASLHIQTCGEDRFVVHPTGQLELNGPMHVDNKGAYLPVIVNGRVAKLRIE